METMIKIYCLNKATELIRKSIYRVEIIEKAKTGVERLDTVVDGFWSKLKDFIENEKNVDRKFIPDFIENLGEEIIEKTIDLLSEEMDIKNLVQKIFNEEKTENPNIF